MNVRDWLGTRMFKGFAFSFLVYFCFWCFLHARGSFESLIKYRSDPGISEPYDVTTNTNFLSPNLVVAPHTAHPLRTSDSTCRLTYKQCHLQCFFSAQLGVYSICISYTYMYIIHTNTNRKCMGLDGKCLQFGNLLGLRFDMDFLLFLVFFFIFGWMEIYRVCAVW